MNKLNFLLVLSAGITVFNSGCVRIESQMCKPGNIPVTNSSNKVKYILFYFVGNIRTDTSLAPFESNPRATGYIYHEVKDSTQFRLLPGETKNTLISNDNSSFCGSFVPGDSLSGMILWFFDSATIASTPWDTIKANNLYDRMLQINRKTIDSLGWKVSYP